METVDELRQSLAERDGTIAALQAERDGLRTLIRKATAVTQVGAGGKFRTEPSYDAEWIHKIFREGLAALAAAPAPPTAAPLAAAEREAARRLGEVSERMYQNCTIDTSGGCDALSAVAPSDWGEWVDALDGWTIARDASRAARGEASDA
jgi:hypothetical protein